MRDDLLRRCALGIATCGLLAAGPATAPEAQLDRALAHYFRYAYALRLELRVETPGGDTVDRVIDAAHERVEGESRWLVRFRAPEHLRDTMLLSLERSRRDRDQFLYLPSQRRVRRVSGSRQEDRIAGTDFAFEDLETRDVSDYTDVRRLGEGHVEGRACVRIGGRPRYDSGYDRIEWCIDPEQSVILELAGYDTSGELRKRLRVDPTSIRVVGDIPVAHSMWMTNAKTDSRTRLHIDFVELAPDFAPDLFSTLSLERSRDIPYLPRFEPAS